MVRSLRLIATRSLRLMISSIIVMEDIRRPTQQSFLEPHKSAISVIPDHSYCAIPSAALSEDASLKTRLSFFTVLKAEETRPSQLLFVSCRWLVWAEVSCAT